MKISVETKLSLGQEVWYVKGNMFKVTQGRVNIIDVIVTNKRKRVKYVLENMDEFREDDGIDELEGGGMLLKLYTRPIAVTRGLGVKFISNKEEDE